MAICGYALCIAFSSRLPLRLGPDVLSRRAHRTRRRGAQPGNQDNEPHAGDQATAREAMRQEVISLAASSLPRGLWPV